MEFKYPTKLTDFNLNTIIQHKRGRSISDKSFFVSLKLKSFFQKKILGNTNYVASYFVGDFHESYRAALHVASKDAVAASLVAYMSIHGVGCDKDESQASHWTKVAAEGGEPVAMARFAKSILEKKPSLAFRLMRDSFLAGNEFAGILLLDSVIAIKPLHETPVFQEIKNKLLENAKSAQDRGFSKAGELLIAYRNSFPD